MILNEELKKEYLY